MNFISDIDISILSLIDQGVPIIDDSDLSTICVFLGSLLVYTYIPKV
jgi:hypothetical protein